MMSMNGLQKHAEKVGMKKLASKTIIKLFRDVLNYNTTTCKINRHFLFFLFFK